MALGEAELFKALGTELKQPEKDTIELATAIAGAPMTVPALLAAKAPHVAVDYRLMVPAGVALTVVQEGGSIVAYGVSGRTRLVTRDGDVSLKAMTGWAEGQSDRGKLTFDGIDGDAIGKTQTGALSFKHVNGDIQAATQSGDIAVAVSPRFAGEVSFHTIRGLFRSDLATFDTDLQPDDLGYVGTLKAPLAPNGRPGVRYQLDSLSGNATVAVQ